METRSMTHTMDEPVTVAVAGAIDCQQFDLVLAEVLNRAQLPLGAQLHLAECADCAALLNDFEAIAGQVRQIAVSEADTIPDLWPNIRDTLRREGIIHANGSGCPPAAPKLVHSATVPRR
ncbi:MAG TPA: hypothetical protein VN515_01655 [Terriglobales bacterium]|nr:hypothetical protein [Terriglobales bacterium]